MPGVGVRETVLTGMIPTAFADLKQAYASGKEDSNQETESRSALGQPHNSITESSASDSEGGGSFDSSDTGLSCDEAANRSQGPDLDLVKDSNDEEGAPDFGAVFDAMVLIMTRRYLAARVHLPKQRSQLDLILGDYKDRYPKEFQLWVQMDPDAFNELVGYLQTHEVFHNDSYHEQKSVAEQTVIALHCLGVYGCVASVWLIAHHFGVSPGLVDLATKQVIAAILGTKALMECVAWPSNAQRYKLKALVLEKCGNPVAANGWLMLDGTHITTIRSGEIINYAIGDVGSANNATGLRRTKLYKDQIKDGPKILLNDGEFCWGDSGYPLHKWLMIPFPLSAPMTVDKSKFNTRPAKIRMVVKHSIGYLKGRFQSLKELRILVTQPSDVHYAALWIRACIHLHMVAFYRERDPDILTDQWARDAVSWEVTQEDAARVHLAKLPKRGCYDFTGMGTDHKRSKAEREADLAQGKAF